MRIKFESSVRVMDARSGRGASAYSAKPYHINSLQAGGVFYHREHSVGEGSDFLNFTKPLCRFR